MVMTRSSKRRAEEETTPTPNLQQMGESHSLPLQLRHHPQALCEANFYSQVVSARYPRQYARRTPCVRNKSTAICTVKKEIRDSLVIGGTRLRTPLSKGNHDTEIQEGSGEIELVSPALLPCEAANDKLVSTNTVAAKDKTNAIEHVSIDILEASINGHSEESSTLKRQTSSFNLTEVAQLLDDDCSSFNSDSITAVVTVGGYKVKSDLAPILQDILLKHGDIADHCSKKSIAFRSMLVENVCRVVQKLQEREFISLSPMEIDGFLGLLHDIESEHVEVRWLHQRLDEIRVAKRLLKESPKVKLTKRQSSHDTKKIKTEIEAHEEEVCKLHKKINSLKHELAARKAEEKKLDEMLSHTKALVKRFHYGSMIDRIL